SATTVVTRPAGHIKRNDDAIAGLQIIDGGADFFHDAHRLVADDVALGHKRRQHLIEVQIGSADCSGGYPNNGIGGILNLWIGDFFDGDVASALPGDCSHECSSL